MAKYIVGKSEIHGTGLFAYQNWIGVGEKILAEAPMLQSAFPNDADETSAAFNRLFDQMSKLGRSEATTLHLVAKKNGFGSDLAPNDFVTGIQNQSEDALEIAIKAFFKACVRGENASCRMFKTLYQLNHSCSPNSERYWNEDDQTMDLRATRNIEPGNEIFISYIDHLKRRNERHSGLGFDCKCSVCTYDWSRMLAHEQRLERLRRSLEVVDHFSFQYLRGDENTRGSPELMTEIVNDPQRMDAVYAAIDSITMMVSTLEMKCASLANVARVVYVASGALAAVNDDRNDFNGAAFRSKTLEFNILATCRGIKHPRTRAVLGHLLTHIRDDVVCRDTWELFQQISILMGDFHSSIDLVVTEMGLRIKALVRDGPNDAEEEEVWNTA